MMLWLDEKQGLTDSEAETPRKRRSEGGICRSTDCCDDA